MKQHYAILVTVLWVALAACSPSVKVPELAEAEFGRSVEGPTQALLVIDSLMWQQPDSALAMLLPWFDTIHSDKTFDRHYAHLLLAELLYKNDYAQTNRAELLQAAH